MTRREFALLSIALLLRKRNGPLDVRIGLVGPVDSKAGRGAHMSMTEAQRAASLLGSSVQLVDMRAANTGTLSGIVLLGDGVVTEVPATTAVIMTSAERGREGDNIFHVQPTEPASDCVVWSGALEKFGASQLNDRYRSAFSEDMDADAWAGWFAVKVLWEAALRSRSDKPADILQYLKSNRAKFDGHKGDLLRFDARGHLVKWQDSESAASYPCSR